MATIQDVRAINTPQKAYEWEVEILGLSTGADENLTFHAQSTTIPEETIGPIEIPFKSRRTFHAGKDESGRTITITFWEDEDHTVYSFFKDWLELMSNIQTGGGVDREGYAAEVVIKTLNTDSETESGRFRLTNAFPTSIGEVTLDYASNEHTTIDITMNFDETIFNT